MKYRQFLDVGNTSQQGYYKDGVELIYPDQKNPLYLAILPAYDPGSIEPTGCVPATIDGTMEENDFYTVVRSAKFVGHGNRRAKTSFLSPKTFDPDADDPYEAFYDYCSRSDKWSYLTKDMRGRRLTGEVEGAVFPRMKNFFVANVMDVNAGTRGGVFVTELPETVMKNILYSQRKNGSRINGIAFQTEAYGDITNPNDALVIEVAWGGKGYVARAATDANGNVRRTIIPDTLLRHRKHMEEPGTFIQRPEGPQEIVDRLAGMLRGYKSHDGTDEINALKEAMAFAYGKDRFFIDEGATESADPFANAAKSVVDSKPEEKAEAVDEAVERAVESERYVPPKDPPKPKPRKTKVKPLSPEGPRVVPMTSDPPDDIPGEDIDPSDIAAVRAMLAGGA